MVRIVTTPIVPQECYGLLKSDGAGSVLMHYAVVKADGGSGRTSSAVDYRADEGTEAELEEIADALKSRWPLTDALLIRRSGVVSVGEIISLVAVAAQASADTFAACHTGLEMLKKMKGIRKQEVFVGQD